MVWLKVAFVATISAVFSVLIVVYGRLYKKDLSPIYISVDSEQAIFETHPAYPSCTMDTSVIDYHLIRLFNDARFVALAKALGNVHLRVGGTKQDCILFKKTSKRASQDFVLKTQNEKYMIRKSMIIKSAEALNEKFLLNKQIYGLRSALKPITLTDVQWNKLNQFCEKTNWKLLFGLNLLLRDHNNRWNSSNAQQLLQYSEGIYKVDWQLGNEPNSYHHKFGKRLSPEEIGKDFVVLRDLLNSSSWWRNSKIAGPDSNRMQKMNSEKFLERFLESDNHVTDSIGFHHARTASVTNFTNPDLLDSLKRIISHASEARIESRRRTSPLWMTETSSAYGGGAEGLTDTFANGFPWLDKLGLAAASGVELIFRQTFFWGKYSLIDNQFNPRPDYWLTLLYKKLVGRRVFRTDLYSSDKRIRDTKFMRAYCHCHKNLTGNLVVYFINLAEVEQEIRMLGNNLQVDGQLYLLESSNQTNLTSRGVKLNGVILEMVDYTTLPKLLPVILSKSQVSSGVSIPPHSFGFLVLNTTIIECLN